FSYFGLQKHMQQYGFRCMDRFDVMDSESKGMLHKSIISLVKGVWPIRFLGHVATPFTLVVAVKDARQ
ncbi:MAG TPA: hypothetical protein PLK99_07600, partial [Burkholderiales bacterium]|nr:hypothetical protein [Burkholderiales bacterium]